MSRVVRVSPTPLACFPRVSGDEPIGGDLIADRITFSPRERG